MLQFVLTFQLSLGEFLKFLKPMDPAGAVEWNVWYRTRVATFDGQDAGLVLGHADRASTTERFMRLVARAVPFVSLSLVPWSHTPQQHSAPGSTALPKCRRKTSRLSKAILKMELLLEPRTRAGSHSQPLWETRSRFL